mgnify:CR=1 FL=1
MGDIKWNRLESVLREGADYLTNAAKSGLPADYELRDNIKFELKIGDKDYVIEFSAPDYWKYVNGGRKPGKYPPPDQIARWISKKNIVPGADRTGRIPSIGSLAFLIGRKISREGVRGNRFYDLAIEDFEKSFTEKIADAITEDVSNQLDEFLKPIGNQTN